MRLHENANDFRDFITFASAELDIADVLIEKDYWVTFSLKNLVNSKYAKSVVFKGGTSLSKAHKIIQRFSEDIDLAVIVAEGEIGNVVKSKIKEIEQACSGLFKEVEVPGKTSKGSKFRKTVWEYPKISLEGEYGDAGEQILLEVNSFTVPEPHEDKMIESLIAEFLRSQGREDQIKEYELEPFQIAVLSSDRTTVEKISAITKGSYTSKENYEVLAKNIRHFYDLAKIHEHYGTSLFDDSSKFLSLLERVKADDLKMDAKQEWTEKKYYEAAIFSDFDNVWKIISPAYSGQFKRMLYGSKELPSDKKIKEIIKLIEAALKSVE